MAILEPHNRAIREVSAQYGLEPQWLKSVIQVESHFEIDPTPRYEDHKNDWSVGLGQVMVSTALWMAQNGIVKAEPARRILAAHNKTTEDGLGSLIREIQRPETNLHLTAAYLAYQMRRYGDIEDAVAAYNAGSVRRNDDGTYRNEWHVEKWRRAMEVFD